MARRGTMDGRTASADLARCDREIRACEATLHTVGTSTAWQYALLGLYDWCQERRLILHDLQSDAKGRSDARKGRP